MHEELKEETIVNKVGGRFRLSSLIQKRLAALNKGARPLVEMRTTNNMDVVIQEIMDDRIRLDTEGRVRATEEIGIEMSLDDMDFIDD